MEGLRKEGRKGAYREMMERRDENVGEMPVGSQSNMNNLLEGQLRESYGRVVYSHKTHEKCSDILLSQLSRIKLAQIILSAITTSGIFTAILLPAKIIPILSVLISTALLVLNAYTKDYDLGELAQKHKQAASDLWNIRECYLSLITDLRMGVKPLESLIVERDDIQKRLHAIYSGTPSTSCKAYEKARKALKENEEMTFSNNEIDQLLPESLRRGNA